MNLNFLIILFLIFLCFSFLVLTKRTIILIDVKAWDNRGVTPIEREPNMYKRKIELNFHKCSWIRFSKNDKVNLTDYALAKRKSATIKLTQTIEKLFQKNQYVSIKDFNHQISTETYEDLHKMNHETLTNLTNTNLKILLREPN